MRNLMNYLLRIIDVRIKRKFNILLQIFVENSKKKNADIYAARETFRIIQGHKYLFGKESWTLSTR